MFQQYGPVPLRRCVHVELQWELGRKLQWKQRKLQWKLERRLQWKRQRLQWELERKLQWELGWKFQWELQWELEWKLGRGRRVGGGGLGGIDASTLYTTRMRVPARPLAAEANAPP